MKRPLTVLLVEDDVADCVRFNEYIEGQDDIQLVAVTNNAKQAFEHATDYQPDVIILDLELHEGGGDGLTFLTTLKRAMLQYTPFVMVTTSNIHSMIHERARRTGAAFIMVKSQADYSPESVVDFLLESKDFIQNSRHKAPQTLELPGDKQKRLYTKIAAEIDRIGVSPKLVGRNYIIDYVAIMIEDSSPVPTAEIAQKYRKSEGSVRFAMQHAIDSTWRHGDLEELQNNYTARVRSDKGVPTLAEFVCYLRDKLTLE